ncbi:phosphotransferase family protein [Frankia sp. CNm7]|uniref:Phosphotransferase family protein n=1 Tax=Frankia nepalensis TaxID=1836974 RepID=A0A937RFN3_9ACTN|nr:phosphotransferase family protein [Frankia nepalensis]MBL7499091.1 phosphotransferase family protein [Frankia nepalensis]MBL7511437.1 phosphotransferase family protein [Frankia nepalensis]MBL7517048.1 phosphotransferase family protein [Frankia nepalensis]MBL7629540.1 phosphotransferase family protein [Frankia nepalensis]
MSNDDALERLTSWFQERLPSATDLRVENSSRVAFGHSAEMTTLTLAWRDGTEERREDLVLRLRPPFPGLLEPYDMARQFTILRALERTGVRGPAVLWLDATGEALGRPFYVMARVDGDVYETEIPAELDARPATIRRMTRALVEQLAAIHLVDLPATGLAALGDGRSYLDDQLDHWTAEMRRVQRGELPALERLLGELRERQPAPSERVTLVHGDPKPGNFAFVDGEVTGVFDWEMAGIGDPLADVGYLDLLWKTPGFFTSRPAALTADEAFAYYEELTGIPVRHREWYRAFQSFKTCVILLVGAALFEAGHSDDPRFGFMALGIRPYARRALRALGVDEDLPTGPVEPRPERFDEARARSADLAR